MLLQGKVTVAKTSCQNDEKKDYADNFEDKVFVKSRFFIFHDLFKAPGNGPVPQTENIMD